MTLPGQGSFGFWGWCAFGGGTGSPATSGTSADCTLDLYGYNTSNPGAFSVHEAIQGTAWSVAPCTSFCFLQNQQDFMITAGTMTLSGPIALGIINIAGPQLVQAGCTITGGTVTCSLSLWEKLPPGCSQTKGTCIYSPDTGIPAAPGKYNLNSLVKLFGFVGEGQIKVVQLS